MPHLVVVGSGALARATCLTLSTTDLRARANPLRVTVLGRTVPALADLCTVAGLRAAAAGTGVRFAPVALPVTEEAALEAALHRARPAAVLVCASTQSPWERQDSPSAWTDLLGRAGFGLTLPFQAQIALAVSRAARAACPRAPVVNACFPDAVNPLLAALDAPVLAGVGNIGLLATAIQASLGLPDQRRLQVLAHHLHLYPPAGPEQEVLAWLDGRPLDRPGALLAGVRSAGRRGLNAVTGALAADLLVDLATGATRDTHLPGVLGMPGGYPVRVRDGGIALRLPDGYPPARARQAQRDWSLADGVLVNGDRVEFAPAARRCLKPLVPRIAAGFAVAELAEATRELQDLRDRLRAGEGGG